MVTANHAWRWPVVTAHCWADHAWHWHARFLAMGVLLPVVYLSDHNISPPIEKQLVLELELWVSSAKGVDRLPSGFGFRETYPLNEYMPST